MSHSLPFLIQKSRTLKKQNAKAGSAEAEAARLPQGPVVV
jgi:hypothetical protein